MAQSAPRRVAFVGIRYGSLSEQLFLAAHAAALELGVELVLVDASSARQASLKTRARNLLVSAGKRLMRHPGRTDALDWFRRAEARRWTRLTPPGRRLDAPGLVTRLQQLGVGAMLVAGCNQILRQPLIEAVGRVANFHNSLLPHYRGVGAVTWLFLNRETVGGYTFHTIESEDIDAGRPLVQETLAIESGDDPQAFTDRLLAAAGRRMPEVLRALAVAEAWPPATAAFAGGSYFGKKQMAAVRRVEPQLTVADAVHRAHVLGSLDLFVGGRRLVLSGISVDGERSSAAPLARRARGRAIALRLRDGWIRVEKVDRLPAVLSTWRL